MEYDARVGVFRFKGNEESMMFVWLWKMLLDTSFLVGIELILRIIFKRPPKRYYKEMKRLED